MSCPRHAPLQVASGCVVSTFSSTETARIPRGFNPLSESARRRGGRLPNHSPLLTLPPHTSGHWANNQKRRRLSSHSSHHFPSLPPGPREREGAHKSEPQQGTPRPVTPNGHLSSLLGTPPTSSLLGTCFRLEQRMLGTPNTSTCHLHAQKSLTCTSPPVQPAANDQSASGNSSNTL